jgi:hypothetical protein
MNMREGIFAKDMKAELEREKSRKGGISLFGRGMSIKPLPSKDYNVPSVLLRHRQVWSPYSLISRFGLLFHNACQSAM